MSQTSVHGLNAKRAQQLLNAVSTSRDATTRIERISQAFVGLPYQTNPLIGSSISPEVFTAGLERFDCVTYVETVLALSRSANVSHFLQTLRRIRYAKGTIDWKMRNHYMTEWIRNNTREGLVHRIAKLKASREKDRVLDVVPGLGSRRMKFTCIPKRELMRISNRVQTGDLIFFVSTRRHLDIFHCGIVIHNGAGLTMRHASRSRGAVVEQPLEEFLTMNRMAGIILVRSTELF